MSSPSILTDVMRTLFLVVLLGLYAAWVTVEIKRDWYERPRRPTRGVALGLILLGALSVLADLASARLHLPRAGWWSTPVVAFLSCLVLGLVRPGAGIETAYRFMTVAVPGSFLAGPFFPLLLALEIGGCLVGFRLGHAIHRLSHRANRSPRQAGSPLSKAPERPLVR